jgi:hypothetical protein
METNKTLPVVISDEMDALLTKAGESTRAGRLDEGIALALKAWNLMPEPVKQWDFYPQVNSRNMVEDYVAAGDTANAKKWIAIMADMYNDPNHEDHLVLMTEGEAMYKLRDWERGYYAFSRIYEIFGRSGFEGEQLIYLEFYLKEKAKRDGG